MPSAIFPTNRLFEGCASNANQPASSLQVFKNGYPGRFREIRGMQIDETAAFRFA